MYLIVCTYVWGDVQIKVNLPSLFADIFRASIYRYVLRTYSVQRLLDEKLSTLYGVLISS